MAPTDLTAASLDRIEAQLLADLDVVRRMKDLLERHQPLMIPAAALSALPSFAAPPAPSITADSPAAAAPAPASPEATAPAPYVPPPRHPNFDIADVSVAVRQVIDTLSGTFGIGDVKSQLGKQHYRTFGDSTIRAVLKSMHEKNELVQTARGIGRGGNKYAKPAPAPSPGTPAV